MARAAQEPTSETPRRGAGGLGAAVAPALSRLRGVAHAMVWAYRRLRRWWDARSEAFRQVVRTAGLLLVTGALSLALGLATATASAPVGPHEARWSVTLDSTLSLDLGPLGGASMESPRRPVGVKVVLGEIPSEASSDSEALAVSADDLGQALSADSAAYMALVTHPEITVDRGLAALRDDGLRRAGLIESVILCLIAAARLAAGGRLRDAVRAALSRDYASALLALTGAAAIIALVVPALRSEPVRGTTAEALAGTPLAEARLSGRLADVVQAYGGEVTQFLEDNDAFYAAAQANLRAAWEASEQVGGTVDVTVADGQAATASLDRQAALEAALRSVGRVPAPDPASTTGASDDGAPGTQEAPGAAATTAADTARPSTAPTSPAGTEGAMPAASAAPTVPATGPWAVRDAGEITAVLSTDLHCNLDVIAFTGVLHELSGADIHMDDGDLTMTGSEPEQACVDALDRAVPVGVERVATIGNHDSQATAQRLRALGWTVTDGTVQSAGGLTVLGDVDPDRTTAAGTSPRGTDNAQQLGARLAATSCQASRAGTPVDLVLIHQPYTFDPLVDRGCAPLLIAGHVHTEKGMTVSAGGNGDVAQLVSGAGQGGTSIGRVRQDAYLHVLSFNADGRLVAWRAVVLHPDASVTVGAWQPLPTADGAEEATADGEAQAGPGQAETAADAGATGQAEMTGEAGIAEEEQPGYGDGG